jgi:phage terminase small subunit
MAKKLEIKKDLLDQLERNGVFGKHYLSLIDDYMDLWDIQKKLKADIKKRGVSIPWSNGGGQSGYKKNDSVADLAKINAQMLKLLSELGLKAEKQEPSGGGHEEM